MVVLDIVLILLMIKIVDLTDDLQNVVFFHDF